MAFFQRTQIRWDRTNEKYTHSRSGRSHHPPPMPTLAASLCPYRSCPSLLPLLLLLSTLPLVVAFLFSLSLRKTPEKMCFVRVRKNEGVCIILRIKIKPSTAGGRGKKRGCKKKSPGLVDVLLVLTPVGAASTGNYPRGEE